MDDTFAFLDDLGGVHDAASGGGGCPPPASLMLGKRSHPGDGIGGAAADAHTPPPYAKRMRPAAAAAAAEMRSPQGPADPTAGGHPAPPALPCTPVMGRAAAAAAAMPAAPPLAPSPTWCGQAGGVRWAPGGGTSSAAATPVPAASAAADAAGDSVSPTSLFDMVGADGGNESDTSGGSGRSTGSGRSSGSGRSASSILSGRKSNIREEMLRLSAAAAVAVNQQMRQLQGGPDPAPPGSEPRPAAAQPAAAAAAAPGHLVSWSPCLNGAATGRRYRLSRPPTPSLAPLPHPPAASVATQTAAAAAVAAVAASAAAAAPHHAAPSPHPARDLDARQGLPYAAATPQRVVTRRRGPLSAHSGPIAEAKAVSPPHPPHAKAEYGVRRLPPHPGSLEVASEELPSDVLGGGTAASCSSPSGDGEGSGGSGGVGGDGGGDGGGCVGSSAGNLTLAERKKRNRESAERSRLRRLAHLGKVQTALGSARTENTALRVQVALAHQRIRYLEYVVEAQGGVGVLPPQVLATPMQRLWEGDAAAAAAAAAAGGGMAAPAGGCVRMPAAALGGGHEQ